MTDDDPMIDDDPMTAPLVWETPALGGVLERAARWVRDHRDDTTSQGDTIDPPRQLTRDKLATEAYFAGWADGQRALAHHQGGTLNSVVPPPTAPAGNS
jgi:hypothetical protein